VVISGEFREPGCVGGRDIRPTSPLPCGGQMLADDRPPLGNQRHHGRLTVPSMREDWAKVSMAKHNPMDAR
jgi:hypothetical protein